jgi:hypothetical protein
LIIILKRRTDQRSDTSVLAFPSFRNAGGINYGQLFQSLMQGELPEVVQLFEIDRETYATSLPWRLESKVEREIWQRVRAYSAPFSDFAEAINRSITTGLNDAYVGQMDSFRAQGVEAGLIRRLTLARNLKRYYVAPSEGHILFPYELDEEGKPRLVDLEGYPGARRYFEGNREELAARRWYGQSVVEAGMSWYGFLYLSHHLLRPKLMFPKIAPRTLFALDSTGEVILLEPAYIAVLLDNVSELYLLAVLNSNLLTAYLRKETTTLSGNFLELQVKYVERLPIRCIHFTTPQTERDRLVADLIAHYECGEHKALLAEVEGLLPKNPDGNFLTFQPGATGVEEKSDVVHDLLAHLAERMITMHEEKQERVEAFWLDLEGVTDTETFDVLRNRGKWESSLWKVEACRPFVDEESHSTRHLDESLE